MTLCTKNAACLVLVCLLAALPSIPAHADKPEAYDVTAATALAKQMRPDFTPEHAGRITQNGALLFQSWEAFYTFIALLHDIEPTTDNLLILSNWSFPEWKYNDLYGWWYFILRVDFDKSRDGHSSIRGPRKEGAYIVASVEEKGVRILGAFGGSYYEFTGTKNSLPVIKPFWPSKDKKDCCFLPPLEWNNTVYQSSK